MNAWIGWGLAALAVVLGFRFYGWQGVLLALSVTVFWLLLQFSRALRAMRAAADRPKGSVTSAVMLQAKLRPGMRLMQIIQLTRSLGEPVSETPEVWRWTDAGGASVTVDMQDGRCTGWRLDRPLESTTSD